MSVPAERLEEFERAWEIPKGLRKLRTVNNNFTGLVFMFSAFAFFFVAGMDSAVLRTQLIAPEATLIQAQHFNQLFTTHGTAMMFLFAVPMLEAIAIFVLPMMLGSRDMPYPRLSAFTIWTFIFGGVLFYSSTFPDIIDRFFLPGGVLDDIVPNVGWFAYPPLSDRTFSPGVNVDFYLIGLGFAEFAAIAAAIEVIVTVLVFRAPGMALHRMPLFAWAMLTVAVMILVSFPAVIVATTFLELERKVGIAFFDPSRGGDPLLWQHLFWFFGHPEVYIMLIPAAGIVSMIIPVFAHRRISGYAFLAASAIATGFMSFGLWVHHMFTVGIPPAVLGLFGAASMVISYPAGVQTFAWLVTLLRAPRIRFTTAMLYVLAFLVTFVFGGITGVMVAVIPFDAQVHDTYFVVAHFHYVLVGGVVFPIMAGLYYWWPKIAGKLLSERVGKIAFWLVFIGMNVTFLPQHTAGLLGMPRRVYTYAADLGLGPHNLVSTLGTYIMALGFIVHGASLIWTVWKGRQAPTDPWGGVTLEWAVSSDSPPYNHRDIYVVRDLEPLRERELERWTPERTRPSGGGRVWREQLVTTPLDARPVAIAVVAGDSYMPFISAVTVTLLSAALLFDQYLVAMVFGVLTVPAFVRWMWPSRAERALEGAGASLGDADLPAHASGTASVAWWAMAFTVFSLAATLSLLVFSHLYLTYGTPHEVLTRRLPLLIPAAHVALVASSIVPHWLALRAVRRGGSATPWLVLGTGALALGALLLGADLAASGFTPHARAYDAIFVTFGGYQVVLAAVAALVSGFVAVQAWLGHFTARRTVAIENALMLSGFTAVSAAVAVATLHVSPYLLP